MRLTTTILIVDAEPDVREVLEEYLCAHGYATIGAANAAAATAMVDLHSIDLALVDVHMLSADGLKFARHLRQRHPKIALVVLTSAAVAFDRIVGVELGAPDYVHKPLDPPEMLVRIADALRRAASRDDPTCDVDG